MYVVGSRMPRNYGKASWQPQFHFHYNRTQNSMHAIYYFTVAVIRHLISLECPIAWNLTLAHVMSYLPGGTSKRNVAIIIFSLRILVTRGEPNIADNEFNHISVFSDKNKSLEIVVITNQVVDTRLPSKDSDASDKREDLQRSKSPFLRNFQN